MIVFTQLKKWDPRLARITAVISPGGICEGTRLHPGLCLLLRGAVSVHTAEYIFRHTLRIPSHLFMAGMSNPGPRGPLSCMF